MIAPAVTAGESPKLLETPIKPIPKVPATVHELPMLTAAVAQMSEDAK